MVLKLFSKDEIYLPDKEIAGYKIQKVIGEGRYGICYLVRSGSRLYIIKQLKKDLLRKTKQKAVYEEEILKRIQNPNIPAFICKIEQKDFTGYVIEFKTGKTFEEIIFGDKYIFQRDEIYKIAGQLINVLKYLHSHGIVHRDIRVPNTLYNNGVVYLIDFGLARWINKKRYTPDVDFSYLGDFLLHLYYTSYEPANGKSRPWYEELSLTDQENLFLKKLMGIEERYKDISDVERDFRLLI